MNRNQENDSDACVCVCVCAAQSEFEFNKHQKWSLSGGRDKLSEWILGGRSQTTASPVNKVNPVKMGWEREELIFDDFDDFSQR